MKVEVLWIIFAVAILARAEVVPVLDTIPLVSQLKSVVQLVVGDKNGAAETQSNYLNGGIGPAQGRSAYFWITGDREKAVKIQKDFLKTMEVVLDGTPVLGHVKGAVHLLAGDSDHGWAAIKSATSTAGSVAGGILAGPVGAIAGHTITDVTISGVDAMLNGNRSEPHGLVNYAMHIGNWSSGEHFDALAGLVMDGLGGRTAAKSKAKGNGNAVVQKPVAPTIAEKTDGGNAVVQKPVAPTIAEKTDGGNAVVQRPAAPTIAEKTDGGNAVVQRPAIAEKTDGAPLKASKLDDTPEDIGTSKLLERRVGADQLLDTVEKQRQLRLLLDDSLMALFTPAELRNNGAFFKFYRFIRENPLYAIYQLHLRSIYDIMMLTYQGLIHMRRTEILMELDVARLRNTLGYLTDTERSMITYNEFRTVYTHSLNPKNCLPTAVAGTVGLDVPKLQSRLSMQSLPENFNQFEGVVPREFLNICKQALIFDYYFSHPILGIDNLMAYLRSHIELLQNSRLLLLEYGSDGGHAIGLKVKKEYGARDPSILLIDYQQPPFLAPGLVNPFRFTSAIDTLNYKSFFVVKLF